MQCNMALCVPHSIVIPLIAANTDLLVTIPSRVADVSSLLVKLKIHPLPIPIPQFRVFNALVRTVRERSSHSLVEAWYAVCSAIRRSSTNQRFPPPTALPAPQRLPRPSAPSSSPSTSPTPRDNPSRSDQTDPAPHRRRQKDWGTVSHLSSAHAPLC